MESPAFELWSVKRLQVAYLNYVCAARAYNLLGTLALLETCLYKTLPSRPYSRFWI